MKNFRDFVLLDVGWMEQKLNKVFKASWECRTSERASETSIKESLQILRNLLEFSSEWQEKKDVEEIYFDKRFARKNFLKLFSVSEFSRCKLRHCFTFCPRQISELKTSLGWWKVFEESFPRSHVSFPFYRLVSESTSLE